MKRKPYHNILFPVIFTILIISLMSVSRTIATNQIESTFPYFDNINFDPASPNNDNMPKLSFGVHDGALNHGINLNTLLVEVNQDSYSYNNMDCEQIDDGYFCSLTLLNPLVEGDNLFYFSVYDNAGNSGTYDQSYVLDTMPPTTIDNAICNVWHSENQNVILGPTDEGSGVAATYYCVADNGNTCDPLSEGTGVQVTCEEDTSCEKFVRYYSIDNAGNNEETIDSCVIQIEKIRPSISGLNVQYPGEQTQAKNGDEIIIAIQAEDENEIDHVELNAMNIGEPEIIYMDHFIWIIYRTTLSVSGTTGDDDQEINATAYDIAGNSNSASTLVKIDNNAPLIDNVQFLSGNPSNDKTPTLTFDVHDADSGVNENTIAVVINSLSYSYPANMSCTELEGIWSCELTTEELAIGDHLFTLNADDVIGNHGTSEAILSVTQPAGGAGTGGDGGGGAGGGGGGVAVVTPSIESGFTEAKTIYTGNSFSFSKGGSSHKAKLDLIDYIAKTVTVTVSSTPQQATISEGQSETFDVDGNGKDDLRVTVVDIISAAKAILTFSSIKEETTAEERTTVEEQQQIAAGEAGTTQNTNEPTVESRGVLQGFLDTLTGAAIGAPTKVTGVDIALLVLIFGGGGGVTTYLYLKKRKKKI